ncbi:apolipoprotein D-like [Brevipalpus obovatus]|uniref:apolipoprotein D-like n=1 Tax=Brevipalpus obovatus TaxID=246614 RepID=UPI003D9E044E
MIIFVFTILVCISTSHGAMSLGGCPTIMRTEDPNFSITNYAGIWYEIARVNNVFETGLKCTKANYTVLPDKKIGVENTGKNNRDAETCVQGTARGDDSMPNLLRVKFNPIMPEAPYWIVKTDFNSYALVVSCMDFFGAIKTENAWLLSRTPTMNEETLKNLLRTLASIRIPTTNLILVDQVNC